ncbi:MAG: ABC transporter ATP-binding protein, partial [Bacteroidota bacterium]
MSPILLLDRVTRRFGAATAVDRLSLAVQPGEIFGLLGHNGAGKTTTIRLSNGLLKPDEGEIRVHGLDPVKHGEQIRLQTGVLTETPAVEGRLTARENLMVFGQLFGVDRPLLRRRVEDLLERFRLIDRADERVVRFSKGMKQRLALARTLLHDPKLIFLDEPSSGLDPVGAYEVRQLIHALSREERRTVVLSTHNLHYAQQLCDRVGVMERGHLRALGTAEELIRSIQPQTRVRISVDRADVELARTLLAQQFNEVDAAHTDGSLLVRSNATPAISATV